MHSSLLSNHSSLVKNVFMLRYFSAFLGLRCNESGIREVRPSESTKSCLVDTYL